MRGILHPGGLVAEMLSAMPPLLRGSITSWGCVRDSPSLRWGGGSWGAAYGCGHESLGPGTSEAAPTGSVGLGVLAG